MFGGKTVFDACANGIIFLGDIDREINEKEAISHDNSSAMDVVHAGSWLFRNFLWLEDRYSDFGMATIRAWDLVLGVFYGWQLR